MSVRKFIILESFEKMLFKLIIKGNRGMAIEGD